MIRPIQEHDLEYERGVKDAACELAETHVLDVLSVIESIIGRLRFNLRPDHDCKAGSAEAVKQGMFLADIVLQTLDEAIELNYQKLVNQADDENQLLDRDEYVADEVRKHLEHYLKGIRGDEKHLDRA